MEAKVVKVLSPTELVINVGSADGVNSYDKFLVYAEGEEIRDPDTGEMLGRLEIVKGKAEVVHIQERITTIRCTAKKKALRDRWVKNPFWIEPKLVTEEVEITDSFQDPHVGDRVRRL